MSQADRVLLLLSDGKWHDLSEIAKILEINTSRLEKIIQFLKEFNLVEYEKLKVRISSDTKNFIDSLLKEFESYKTSSIVSL